MVPVMDGVEPTLGVGVGRGETDAVGVLVGAAVGAGVDRALLGALRGVVTCAES